MLHAIASSMTSVRPSVTPLAGGVLGVLAMVLGHGMLPAAAAAQIRPVLECTTLNRPIRVIVGSLRPSTMATSESDAFQSPSAESAFTLLLVATDAQSAETVIESRPVSAGEVDLAEVFPRLWKTDDPRVLHVQAATDESGRTRIGAPLTLVPMLTPRYAPRVDRTGTPQVNPPPPTDARTPPASARAFSGYWTFVDQRLILDMGSGEMAFALRADAAPYSVLHLRRLVQSGFYEGVGVHRIASLSGQTAPEIVQFGDPTGTGLGGPGFLIDFEPSPLTHAFGTLSLARTSDPNSAGSQVFITLSADVGPALNGKYTALGRLVDGADVLRSLAKTPTGADARPREPIVIRSARLVDAPPIGTKAPQFDELPGTGGRPAR